MVPQRAAIAVALFLLPVLIVQIARSRHDRKIWEIALDVPFAVALDLLGVLLLARAMPLERAVLVSRPLWIVGGMVYVAYRLRSGAGPAWPRALGGRELLLGAVVAAVAVYLSTELSRPCLNSDRHWHIPLVTSLRGQRIPFANVYEPNSMLGYHYTGDVLAAMLQTLSFGIIHSSHALSLAHDILFGLAGLSLALLLRWWGFRSMTAAALGVLGVFLTGPATLLRTDGRPIGGYNFVNYLRISYRPHVPLAGLLLIGFIGAFAVRLRDDREPIPLSRTAGVLIAVTALMGITDEASVGILGLALGTAWIVEPRVIHPKRLVGIAVLFGLLLALAIPNLLFPASLAPGAPHHDITLVPWRSPGYTNKSLPLELEKGQDMLLYDILPMLGIWFAGTLSLFRARTRENTAALAFITALVLVSVFALTRIDVDGQAIENHRFMTAAMLGCPILGLVWLSQTPLVSRRRPQAGVFVAAVIVVSLGLSAATTTEWLRAVLPRKCIKPKSFYTWESFFKTNCRREFATALRFSARPEYIAKPIVFAYAGCRPVFLSGRERRQSDWEVKVGSPQFGYRALQELHRSMLSANEPLAVVCTLRKAEVDPLCAYAKLHGVCTRAGARAVRCEISGEQRAFLLSNAPK